MNVPEWLTDEYVLRVRTFLSGSRILLVRRPQQLHRDIVYTLPEVDPYQLLNSPGWDIADVYRDAVLAKFLGVRSDRLSRDALWSLFRAYLSAKRSVADDFLEELVSGVKL